MKRPQPASHEAFELHFNLGGVPIRRMCVDPTPNQAPAEIATATEPRIITEPGPFDSCRDSRGNIDVSRLALGGYARRFTQAQQRLVEHKYPRASQ